MGELLFQKQQELPSPQIDSRPLPLSFCYDGQLTDLGKQTTFRLGSALRSTYVDKLQFLPPQLTSQEASRFLFFRATPVPRAVESLQNVVSGLLGTDASHASIVVRDYQ